MSDFAEDMEAMREHLRKKKAANLKWNTDVIMALSEELDFEVKCHSEFHLSLFHKSKGRLDIWPSTRRGCWHNPKTNKPKGTFIIPDMEQYILKHFKTT